MSGVAGPVTTNSDNPLVTDIISRERELALLITIVWVADVPLRVTLPKAKELGETLTSADRWAAKTG